MAGRPAMGPVECCVRTVRLQRVATASFPSGHFSNVNVAVWCENVLLRSNGFCPLRVTRRETPMVQRRAAGAVPVQHPAAPERKAGRRGRGLAQGVPGALPACRARSPVRFSRPGLVLVQRASKNDSCRTDPLPSRGGDDGVPAVARRSLSHDYCAYDGSTFGVTVFSTRRCPLRDATSRAHGV